MNSPVARRSLAGLGAALGSDGIADASRFADMPDRPYGKFGEGTPNETTGRPVEEAVLDFQHRSAPIRGSSRRSR